MKSLRVRLVLLLGVAIVLGATIQFMTSFSAAMKHSNQLFDYHMQQMALAVKDSGFEQMPWHILPGEENKNADLVVQIWNEDGAHVFQSRPYRFLPEQAVPGFSTVTIDDSDWRIYVIQQDRQIIQVAQKMKAIQENAMSFALYTLWPVIPVTIFLILAAWGVVTSALAPLNRIGHDLGHRNANSLSPISDAGVPREVAPLVAELNSLLVRMTQALRSQQQFVADAAHELRSPVTALKLQVQTLARAKDETARSQAINRLLGGVERASRLVVQLLALARQDPLSQAFELTEITLSDCVEQAAADVTPLAQSMHIRLQYGSLAPANVMGDAESLRVMVRNLLDNAIRYTPENGQVLIGLDAVGSNAVLTIQDTGSGIPAQDRTRVFDRFYRVPGTSQNGTGLGLAIVQAIAHRHGATVELDEAVIGGLAVKVTLPALAGEPAPARQVADATP